jgi:hypothetical protein
LLNGLFNCVSDDRRWGRLVFFRSASGPFQHRFRGVPFQKRIVLGSDSLFEAILPLLPFKERLDYFGCERPRAILHGFLFEHSYFDQRPAKTLGIFVALLSGLNEAPGRQPVPYEPVVKLFVRLVADCMDRPAPFEEDRLDCYAAGKPEQPAEFLRRYFEQQLREYPVA